MRLSQARLSLTRLQVHIQIVSCTHLFNNDMINSHAVPQVYFYTKLFLLRALPRDCTAIRFQPPPAASSVAVKVACVYRG